MNERMGEPQNPAYLVTQPLRAATSSSRIVQRDERLAAGEELAAFRTPSQTHSGLVMWVAWAAGLLGLLLLGYSLFAAPSQEDRSTDWVILNDAVSEALNDLYPPVAEPVSSSNVTRADNASESQVASSRSTGAVEEAESAVPALSADVQDTSAAPAEAKVVPELDGRINLNTATAEQLMELHGIGESKAKAIIEYRTKHGPFKTPEQLMNVSGIGPKTYAKLQDRIKAE